MRIESAGDLLTRFRQLADAEGIDELWTDEELLEYANDAQREFAQETLCFPDSTTFSPAISVNSPWVDIDPRILKTRSCRLATLRHSVEPITHDDLLKRYFVIEDYGRQTTNDWESEAGIPKYLVTDLDDDRGRLVPQPTSSVTQSYTTAATGNESGESTVTVTAAIDSSTPQRGTLLLGSGQIEYAYTSWTGSTFTLDGTLAEDNNSVVCLAPEVLNLTVYREQIYALECTGDLLEIPERYRRHLVYGMMTRALEKQDVDTFGNDTDFEGKWERLLHEAYTHLRVRHRPAGTTGYGGI